MGWTAVSSQNDRPHAKPADGSTQQNTDKESLRDPLTWLPITWFTFFLVIVGGLQGYLFYWQLGFLKSADETARRAADAATEAARAATLSANAVLGIELPRLELESVYFKNPVHQAESIRSGDIQVVFRNRGKNAATIVHDCIQMFVGEVLPETPYYSVFRRRVASIGEMVDGNKVHLIDCTPEPKITAEDAKLVANGHHTLRVFGIVAYKNFLDDIWFTKFCVVYVPVRNAGGAAYFRNEIDYPNYTGRTRKGSPES